jgi:hypothetical protein
VQRAVDKAERRTHAELLPKISERDANGRLVIRDDLPEIFHLHKNTTLLDADDDWLRLADWRPLFDTFMRDYRTTLQADRRNCSRGFTYRIWRSKWWVSAVWAPDVWWRC